MNTRRVAALLRELADEVERGDDVGDRDVKPATPPPEEALAFVRSLQDGR